MNESEDGWVELWEQLRQERTIISSPRRGTSHLTVVVRLHNSEPYLETVRGWLTSQTLKTTGLLVCDNASTDATWSLIQDLPSSAGWEDWTIVRNPRNLGGFGSLLLNLDLVQTDWLTDLHQDDFYYPNHVSVHFEGLKNVAGDVGFFHSQMGSFLLDPMKFGAPPRANWFLNEPQSDLFFAANLRAHVIPNPVTSWRKSILESTKFSWHNTAFADTELALKTAHWRYMSSSIHTANYRENPASESHHSGQDFNQLATAIGIIDSIGNPSSEKILQKPGFRGPQGQSLISESLKSIEMRLGDNEVSRLVKTYFLEKLLQINGPHPYINFQLADIYAELGGSVTAGALMNQVSTTPNSGLQGPSSLASGTGHKFSFRLRALISLTRLIPSRRRVRTMMKFSKRPTISKFLPFLKSKD